MFATAVKYPRTGGGWVAPRGKGKTNCIVSQAHRLRRLYHLFEYDAVTQREGVRVNVEGVDEEREGLSKHAVTRGPFVG